MAHSTVVVVAAAFFGKRINKSNGLYYANRAAATSAFTKRIQRSMTKNQCLAFSSKSSSSSMQKAYIAVGSNLGNRSQNIIQGIAKLCDNENDNNVNQTSSQSGTQRTRLMKTSCLYETPPMYMTNQPPFLNGVFQIQTTLQPHELIYRIKQIEHDFGRNIQKSQDNIPNGPRPLDMDIILYGNDSSLVLNDHNDINNNTGNEAQEFPLVIPHPLMQEREFVLRPLVELLEATRNDDAIVQHPVLGQSIQQLWSNLIRQQQQQSLPLEAVQIIPLPRNRMLHFNKTIIMGILNVTPDSFSDGGQFYTDDTNHLSSSSLQSASAKTLVVEQAVKQALDMIQRQGVDIIDIGGESTRPGAKEVPIQEELNRVIPVIQQIRQVDTNVVISIDTRHALVAQQAVDAGADIVNDVSGGQFDPDMLSTVAAMKNVPIILMHMRGTPETMTSLTDYGNNSKEEILDTIIKELRQSSKAAERAGIPRWLQILDPGIGFAKTGETNLILLRHLNYIQRQLGNVPLLLGVSRKRFIKDIVGNDCNDRDLGTIGACTSAICLGQAAATANENMPPPPSTILRVHNVHAVKQATKVMDAILMMNTDTKK